jgi:hypothetical protein
MADYKDFDGNQVKHMEMIQTVIARMAGNSSLVRGWALTLTGALLGFAVDRSDSGLAATALIPVAFFWGLDTYYLRTERLFRALYNSVRTNATHDPFYMSATDEQFVKSAGKTVLWRNVFRAPTLFAFYFSLGLVTVVLVIVLCSD